MARGQDRRTRYDEVTVQTAEISEWLDFEFYDLVYWYDKQNMPDVSNDVRRLARWLGISHHVGSDMCYWLITESGKLIKKTSLEHVTCNGMLASGTKQQIDIFNTNIEEWLDDTSFMVDGVAGFELAYLDGIKVIKITQVLYRTEGLLPLMRIMET